MDKEKVQEVEEEEEVEVVGQRDIYINEGVFCMIMCDRFRMWSVRGSGVSASPGRKHGGAVTNPGMRHHRPGAGLMPLYYSNILLTFLRLCVLLLHIHPTGRCITVSYCIQDTRSFHPTLILVGKCPHGSSWGY